jgi:Tol biopolymer transport system component/C-terminal processing protease CtpA/Prc
MANFKSILTVVSLLTALSTSATAKQNEWFLHSSIAPNGEHITFSYKGDIYIVGSDGGTARPLTIDNNWDGHPIWSRDGKKIAFASDRNGNLDIYTMPATGGNATRLTYHSANDIPQDFSKNGNEVLFTSARTDAPNSTVFPTTRLTESYAIALTGGTPRMVSTLPASELQYSPDGKKVLYRDEKSYENQFRKHDVSAFARDIWLHDLQSGEHRQLTTYAGADHNPIWSDRNTFYYTSEEKSGAFNVWRADLDGGNKKQMTTFKQHPVRSLSISDNGVLAYVHHGSIYTQKGSKAKHVNINIANDVQVAPVLPVSLKGKVTEFAVSPDGKEVAFIARGEVFVASTDFKTTRAITNTPEQERSVSFHKDGRTLLYAAERQGVWGLYEASIAHDDEPYFFAATTLNETLLHSAKTDSFQPVYSPDGNKVAFLSARDEIQVVNRKSKHVDVALNKKHNYSYSDGDISFVWAPDSHWMTASFSPRNRLFINNIGVFPADGSAEPVDVSLSGYSDGVPTWHTDGNAVLWASTRYGQRDHGSWGREADVMAAFLTHDAYDKFRLSKEEYALFKELEKKNKDDKKDDTEDNTTDSDQKDDSDKDKKSKKDSDNKPLNIEWDDLDQRTVRLTLHASDLGDAYLTKNTAELYYLARFEKGYDLWRHNIRERKTELVAKLNAKRASLTFSADEKKLYVLADGNIRTGKVGSKITMKTVAVAPVLELQQVKEREFMFAHSWRVIKDKFYRDDMHGINWDAMGQSYQKKLTSIGHNRDFANMFAEMTGELNASHIGSSYYKRGTAMSDSTGALGLLFDLTNTNGPLTVLEVLKNSPFDSAKSQVNAGVKLTAVNGITLNGKQNLYHLLNRKAGKRVRFSFTNKAGEVFEEVIKPSSIRAINNLLYKRWVASREALVDKLSNGRLAYVHVRGMNDPSFRQVYSSLLGKHFDKEAVVIDTRFNGGGWLHNDLAKLLMGEEYFSMHVRGRKYHGDPLDQWNKPSVLVINEGNYSDAHAFSYTYDQLDIGQMVGMPVPGTMTAVWWETGISGDFRAGVPQVGMKNTKGEYLENNQTEPDFTVKNDPQSSANGEDKQIEKAVEVMLKQLKQQ